MRGIRLSHGVTFVECDGVTVRISAKGKCELSPIMFASLEWDMRTEPPEKWRYLTESDIASLGKKTLGEIDRVVAEVKDVLGK